MNSPFPRTVRGLVQCTAMNLSAESPWPRTFRGYANELSASSPRSRTFRVQFTITDKPRPRPGVCWQCPCTSTGSRVSSSWQRHFHHVARELPESSENCPIGKPGVVKTGAIDALLLLPSVLVQRRKIERAYV